MQGVVRGEDGLAREFVPGNLSLADKQMNRREYWEQARTDFMRGTGFLIRSANDALFVFPCEQNARDILLVFPGESKNVSVKDTKGME